MILSDVTWMLLSVSLLPLTTGVGAEKLTLGPAIGGKCFYGSVEESERRRRSESVTDYVYPGAPGGNIRQMN
jgi:hypothetical protein